MSTLITDRRYGLPVLIENGIKYITTKHAVQLIGVSRHTIDRLIQKSHGKYNPRFPILRPWYEGEYLVQEKYIKSFKH